MARLQKPYFIDRVPTWAAALLAVAYVVVFVIILGVGGAGPAPAVRSHPTLNAPSLICADPRACVVTLETEFLGLSGYNQALWVVARMSRPNDTATGKPALLQQKATWGQSFELDAWAYGHDGNRVELADNVTHSGIMTCEAGSRQCGFVIVFVQAFLYYRDYHIRARFSNPIEAFVEAGLPAANLNLAAPLEFDLRAGYVAEAYTKFQMAGKYTFTVFSIIMLVIYVVMLDRGRGANDPRNGRSLETTTDQIFVAVLGALLVWYNDPTFAANVTAPTFVVSGFYAVCAVTFLAALLLFWLVTFDLNRVPQTEQRDDNGRITAGATACCAKRFHCSAITAALCFWLPKIIWVTISWLLVLAFYMIQRASLLQDPAYNIFQEFPLVAQFFTTFIATWGGLYVLYLAVLMIMGCYNCRVIRPAGRFVIAVTVVSIIVILIGFFQSSIMASSSAIDFMATTGAANCYIWFLMVAYMPIKPMTADELDALEASAARDAASGASKEAAPYGGIPEGMRLIRDAPMTDAFTQTEDIEAGAAGRRGSDDVTLRPEEIAFALGAGGAAGVALGSRPTPVEALPPSAPITSPTDDEEALAGGGNVEPEWH